MERIFYCWDVFSFLSESPGLVGPITFKILFRNFPKSLVLFYLLRVSQFFYLLILLSDFKFLLTYLIS